MPGGQGYVLRRCTSADVALLTRFRLRMFREFHDGPVDDAAQAAADEGFFARAFAGGGAAWVAEDAGGAPVASAAVVLYELPPKPWALDGRTAYICSMYTEPEHRRRGLARKLFVRCMEYARAAGVSCFTLHAAPMGRVLYESFGLGVTNEMRLIEPSGEEGG